MNNNDKINKIYFTKGDILRDIQLNKGLDGFCDLTNIKKYLDTLKF